MKVFILCYLLPALSLAASRPLDQQLFQTQIRPQLQGIDQDIQQIFLAMPGYPADVIKAMDLTDQLLRHTYTAQTLCPRVLNPSCLPQLQNTLQVLRQLDRLWLSQESHSRPTGDASLSSLLGSQRWLQLQEVILSLRGSLEASAIAVSSQPGYTGLTMAQWRKLTDEADGRLNLLVIEYVPARLQEDFRSAWMNFFRPLRHQALLHNNALFLTTNLDSLNFYWNLLNVKLTKRLKKTPEGMQGPLNAIQNRWNQVMRICFGQ